MLQDPQDLSNREIENFAHLRRAKEQDQVSYLDTRQTSGLDLHFTVGFDRRPVRTKQRRTFAQMLPLTAFCKRYPLLIAVVQKWG